MIFTVILICVLGRDFGLMLQAERASQPMASSHSRGAINEVSRPEPVSNKGSLAVSSPNDNNEKESSMDASEKGESCCHQRTQKDNGTVTTTSNVELQRYSNEAREEDSGETLYTGRCV